MVFNARAHAKYRAIGFYGVTDMEASFSNAIPSLLYQVFCNWVRRSADPLKLEKQPEDFGSRTAR
jgi:hypothetical protein